MSAIIKLIIALLVAVIASALAMAPTEYNVRPLKSLARFPRQIPTNILDQLEQLAEQNIDMIRVADPDIEVVPPAARQKRSPACRTFTIRSRSGRVGSVRRC